MPDSTRQSDSSRVNKPSSWAIRIARSVGEKSEDYHSGRPRTVAGKITYLLDPNIGNPIVAANSSIDDIPKRKKPSTFIGRIAFICGTRKSTIRNMIWLACLTALIIVGAACWRRFTPRSVDYWGREATGTGFDSLQPPSGADSVVLRRYGERAAKAFRGLSAEQQENVQSNLRSKLEGNAALRESARKVYETMSPENKKEAQKLMKGH